MASSENDRHTGYVVGQNKSSRGSDYWVVRVKDPQSPYNGNKFPVASVHDDIELAQGLNVSFTIGSTDGAGGERVPKAVDVRLL